MGGYQRGAPFLAAGHEALLCPAIRAATSRG